MEATTITVEQARAIIEEAEAVGHRESDERVRKAMQAARDAAARMTETVGALYIAVASGDRWIPDVGVSLFGESLWGNIDAPHGVHVVLENAEGFHQPTLIEGQGLVALDGHTLAWYLGEVEDCLGNYGTAE